MKIGCIGRGMVGNAIYEGLKHLNNEMSFYDPVYTESKMTDIMNSECCFIAVPTLPNENNDCDLSILFKVLAELHEMKYDGIICIKSTITPGTTQKMIEKYNNPKICFCPEFLKERSAYEDFISNNPICVVGTLDETTFECIKKIHVSISKFCKMVPPTEAELTKYMQNVYNTYRILFSNGFYEVCKHNNVNYESCLQSLLYRGELDEKYMKCNEKLRGPSGPCLVKDCLEFNNYVNRLDLKIKPKIFQTIVDDMKLYPKTVIDGTRSEKEYFGRELTTTTDAKPFIRDRLKNIILTSREQHSDCLGHELHITRCVVIDMLLQNYIHKDDIIVVRNKDRKFLYEKMFDTVLEFNELILIHNGNKFNVINLTAVGVEPNAIVRKEVIIPNFQCSENYYTDNFKNNLLKINYYSNAILLVNKDFVVIHHRFNSDLVELHKTCEKLLNLYGDIHIIIFNNNINFLSNNLRHKNLVFIDNLQLYASYLNHEKCKLFISEWSGGGQLSQYCYSGTILYYFNHYKSYEYLNKIDELTKKAISTTYHESWDFKNPNNSSIKMYENLDSLLNNLPKL